MPRTLCSWAQTRATCWPTSRSRPVRGSRRWPPCSTARPSAICARSASAPAGGAGRSAPAACPSRCGWPPGSGPPVWCWPPTSTPRGWPAPAPGRARSCATTSAPRVRPPTELDLVHARLVLTHVPQREAALTSMIAALRSGGWILVEDADPGLQPLLCPDDYGPGAAPGQPAARRLPHVDGRPRRRPRLRPHAAPAAARARAGRRRRRRLLPDHRAGLHDAGTRHRRADPRPAHRRRASPPTAEIDQHLANIATGQVPTSPPHP